MTGMPAALAFATPEGPPWCPARAGSGPWRPSRSSCRCRSPAARCSGWRRHRCTCRRRPRPSSGCSACRGPPSAAAGSCSTTRRRCSRLRRSRPAAARCRRRCRGACRGTAPTARAGRRDDRDGCHEQPKSSIHSCLSSSEPCVPSRNAQVSALGYTLLLETRCRSRGGSRRSGLIGSLRLRSITRSPARPGPSSGQPAGRVGQERLEGELGGAEQRGVHAERRRDDADQRARRRQGARSSSRSSGSATNGWIRPKRPPRTMSRGLKTLTRPPARSRASARPRRARCRAAGEPAAASRSTASTAVAPPPAGRPARRSSARLADLGLPAADRAAADTAARPD